MKKYAIGIWFLFAILNACAQTDKPYDLIPYRKNTLWGFADTSRKIIITPQFNEVNFFDDEIVGVKKDKKWAFIDKKGKLVTEYKYDAVGGFNEGMSQVMFNKKVGYINNKGKEVVPPAYKFCEDFSEGLGIVRDSADGKLLSGVIDKTGKLILAKNLNIMTSQFHSGYIAIKENEKVYFINKAGKRLNLPQNVELLQEFSEGVALVKVADYKISMDNKRVEHIDTTYYLCLINLTGKLITDSIADGNGKRIRIDNNCFVALNFTNGFAVLQNKFTDYNWYAGSFENNQYAFLDKTGKLSNWYISARAFGKDKLTIITKKGEYSATIIDDQFNIVTSSVAVKDAGVFSDGLLRVKITDYGKWSFINKLNKSPFAGEYDETSDFVKGIAVVKVNGKQGCINKRGVKFWE